MMAPQSNLPPSPCERCPQGPSSICFEHFRDAGKRNSGGCVKWTNWYQESWRQLRRIYGFEENDA